MLKTSSITLDYVNRIRCHTQLQKKKEIEYINSITTQLNNLNTMNARKNFLNLGLSSENIRKMHVSLAVIKSNKNRIIKNYVKINTLLVPITRKR